MIYFLLQALRLYLKFDLLLKLQMSTEKEKLLQEYAIISAKHDREEENLRKSIHIFYIERFELRDKKK